MMSSLAPKITIISIKILLASWLIACCAAYEGPSSDHFDGSKFFNNESDHTFLDMIKWLWQMEIVEWPEWIEDPPQPKPLERIEKGGLRLTYVNHATVLIQIDGLNILTDPIWSFRAGPSLWLGTKRVRAPGVRMDELPSIHYILISHDHYDHLDLPTLRKIANSHHPIILAGLGTKSLLAESGIDNIIEMDWWQSYTAEDAGVKFTCVPARHGSGRWPFRENKTIWVGFIIEDLMGQQIYFAGDTAFGKFLNSIAERFGNIRLAILPIGNYEKRWFMKTQHMNPDDAVRAHILLGASQSVGIHFGTFAEHPEQAIDAHEKDLAEALEKYDIPPSRFWILKFGEGRDIRGKGQSL
ncbi:MAG: MBL fold metallo-hydrolase [Deltaproteobacteria bacterium]|nr:MAG: MBL fold metallo-hydrolase [Deltaproteobacteria bacterium]